MPDEEKSIALKKNDSEEMPLSVTHISIDLKLFSKLALGFAFATISLIVIMFNFEVTMLRGMFVSALGETLRWTERALSFIAVLSLIAKFENTRFKLDFGTNSTLFCVWAWLSAYIVCVLDSFLQSYAKESGFLG